MVKDEGRGSCEESESEGVRFVGGKESKGVARWGRSVARWEEGDGEETVGFKRRGGEEQGRWG
eukprot:2494495-Rhodomonas_salina.2